jgi:hypothetical protein
MPNATFRTRHVLLTYSQVGEREKVDLVTFLQDRRYVHAFIVGEERHQDGGRHFHAYFVFSKRCDISTTFFDWDGLHPNIESVRQQLKAAKPVVDYVTKEDQSPILWPSHTTWPWSEEGLWSRIAEADSRDEALALIRQHKPRDFVINRRNIDFALDAMFPPTPPPTPVYALESFVQPPEFREWADANFGMFPL